MGRAAAMMLQYFISLAYIAMRFYFLVNVYPI